MYETLLCTQLLGAKNPHCLKAGAHNDTQDEDEGGVVYADRLPNQYNALDFRAPDKTTTFYGNSQQSLFASDDGMDVSSDYSSQVGSANSSASPQQNIWQVARDKAPAGLFGQGKAASSNLGGIVN